MAQYIKIPKDLDNIREKFMFGLTKRQVICFAIGFLIGIPIFFLMKGKGIEVAILCMGLAAAPAIICGIYKKNGITFEKQIKYIIAFFKKPKTRLYNSENIYTAIEKQIEVNRLTKLLSGGIYVSFKKENQKGNKKI